jgi:hypothetical protein
MTEQSLKVIIAGDGKYGLPKILDTNEEGICRIIIIKPSTTGGVQPPQEKYRRNSAIRGKGFG